MKLRCIVLKTAINNNFGSNSFGIPLIKKVQMKLYNSESEDKNVDKPADDIDLKVGCYFGLHVQMKLSYFS